MLNTKLDEVKRIIISLGIKKSELQKIMDEIFIDRTLGESCSKCRKSKNVRHFKLDGFKIHSCPSCPNFTLE
jgi:hypothetical protein